MSDTAVRNYYSELLSDIPLDSTAIQYHKRAKKLLNFDNGKFDYYLSKNKELWNYGSSAIYPIEDPKKSPYINRFKEAKIGPLQTCFKVWKVIPIKSNGGGDNAHLGELIPVFKYSPPKTNDPRQKKFYEDYRTMLREMTLFIADIYKKYEDRYKTTFIVTPAYLIEPYSQMLTQYDYQSEVGKYEFGISVPLYTSFNKYEKKIQDAVNELNNKFKDIFKNYGYYSSTLMDVAEWLGLDRNTDYLEVYTTRTLPAPIWSLALLLYCKKYYGYSLSMFSLSEVMMTIGICDGIFEESELDIDQYYGDNVLKRIKRAGWNAGYNFSQRRLEL